MASSVQLRSVRPRAVATKGAPMGTDTKKAAKSNGGLVVKSGIRAGSGKLTTNHTRVAL